MNKVRRLEYTIILFVILLPVIALAASPIELPRTGQIWSFDPAIPQKDDGGVQAGAVLPEPRFTANNDTIADNLTGLIWAKDAGTPTLGPCTGGAKTWQQALDYVACLNANNHLGFNDWHLPNINELESLIDLSQTIGHFDWHLPNLIEFDKDHSQMGLPYTFGMGRIIDLSQNHPPLPAGHPFANVRADFYWSSTSDAVNALEAWNVSIGNGDVADLPKSNRFYVWPVRTGKCGPGNSAVCLPKTGQTASTAAGDDGDIKAGVAWPAPRFSDNGNQTITDKLTGLIWTKNAGEPTFGPCAGGMKTWPQGIEYIKCLNDNNYLGHNDWRMPNRKEISSLIDRSKNNPAIPSGHPFSLQRFDRYWSSSSDMGETRGAWYLDILKGELIYKMKYFPQHVWPVRAGKVDNPAIYSFSISPESETFTYSGGTDSVKVSASSNTAVWTATSNAPWLTITSGSNGKGTGILNFTASPNNGAAPRTGTLNIAGKTFTVTQLNTGLAGSAIQLPRTGQVTGYSTGDDGNLQKGVAGPDPRFTVNAAPENDTVTDNLTGLVWAKDAGTPSVGPCKGGAGPWQQALDYVACLNTQNYLGHNDWHLPNMNELESLVDLSQSKPSLPAGSPFDNVQPGSYWSSSTYASNTSFGWYLYMNDGHVNHVGKGYNSYAWPVRSWQCGPGNSAVCLAKTGQTASYAAGDDGDLKAGVAWPAMRFICNGDGTVSDNLTGLIWTKDANAPGPSECAPGGEKTWQKSIDYVACLNKNVYLGFNDWRLPNRKELDSLLDRSKYNPPISSGHPFINVQMGDYWSSSTLASNPSIGWFVCVGNCSIYYHDKNIMYYVWPVRSGQ